MPKEMIMTARRLAFEVLEKIRSGAYSNISLDAALRKAGELDAKDAALASNLVYGVTERLLTLDYQLEPLLDKPLTKLRGAVLTVLRLGAYQILFCDRIPDSAAVNESVSLVRGVGCSYAAGLVNAVLRRLCERGLLLPEKEGTAYYLSIKYSCEKWIAQTLKAQYGEKAEEILCRSLQRPPVSLRVNTVKTDADSLLERLKQEGIDARKSTVCENALLITKTGMPLDRLKSFREGLFHVQDASCQRCCEALGAKPGETVLDMCAAPGGKSFTVAERMENTGTVKSFDIFPEKIDLIEEGAARLGLGIVRPCVHDASKYMPSLAGADRVLCDVPCSGIGIIARKPEIKYKKQEDVRSLPAVQEAILFNASRYVRQGGRLVYSTCTLFKEENEQVCEKFLRENPDFVKIGDWVTILPGEDGDGFFYAVFERRLSDG